MGRVPLHLQGSHRYLSHVPIKFPLLVTVGPNESYVTTTRQ